MANYTLANYNRSHRCPCHVCVVCHSKPKQYNPRFLRSDRRSDQFVSKFQLKSMRIRVHVLKRGAAVHQVADVLPVVLHFSQRVGPRTVAFVSVVQVAQLVFVVQPFACLLHQGEFNLPFAAAYTVR